MKRRLVASSGWLLLAVSFATRAAPLTLTEDGSGRELSAEVEILRDEAGRLSYAEVTQAATVARFAPAGPQGLNFGFTRAAYWYRFTLDNPSDSTQRDWVLEIAWPPLDFLDAYVESGGAVQHLQSGDQRPPGAAGISHHNFALPLFLPPGASATVHLRAQIDGAHQLPLKLWNAQAFYENSARDNMLFGMFYGIMLVMVIYNLLIYFVLRDVSYGYYLLFLISIAALLVNLDGFAFPWLWSLSPKLINGSVPVTIALASVFVPRFIQVSLQTRQHTPRLHRLLNAGFALALIGVVLPFVLPIMESTFINALIGAVTTVLMAAVIAVQAAQGRRTARFYAVVWAALLVGIVAKVMQVNGMLPVNAFTVYSIHIGACLLVTLVSLALADQINNERRERARLLREKAEARADAQSEFLAKMSHELRTPMNAIVGFTDLALRDRSEEKRIQHLRLIDGASRSLLGIVNNVLDLTRIESGKLSLEETDFNLPAQLDKVLSLMRPSARKGVALKLNLGDDVPAMLVGDPLRLEQVLVNLVNNALKFTERGEVELNVRADPVDASRAHLEFSVRDTGVGIAGDRLPQLFKPFTQADQSTTRKYGGSGLGLTICKQLVELMGGRLTAQSTPGQGSEFRFDLNLPVSRQPLTAPPKFALREPVSETEAAQRTRGAKVLLVEDNAMNRRLAREILGDAGVLLDFAEHGGEAVDAVQKKAFDLVLMDVQMPVMDGYEATRRIRALPGFDTLPIIAMTANALNQDREQAAAAGMNDFLAKPIDATQVLEMLAKWLPLRTVGPKLEDQLERLAQLLAARDFQAQACLRDLEVQLRQQDERIARALTTALEGFDFEAALAALRQLRDKNSPRTQA
ncbi:MAG: 7TM diverse intracellular signaling domain-containing protein [Pseudomonadota bacterium]